MKLYIVLCFCLFSSACTTHYYIVRHAEKSGNNNNDPLLDTGFVRADVLRDSLLGKSIDTVFSSIALRTRQTASPTAIAFGKRTTQIQNQTDTSFLNDLKHLNGKSVLIVGHTNTIPTIIFSLTNRTIPTIPDWDYDNMYHIKISKRLSHKITFTTSRYGAVSLPPQE